MQRRSVASLLLAVTLLLCPGTVLAKSQDGQVIQGYVVDVASIPAPPGHSYDYSEPIEEPGKIETRVVFSETYSTPKMVTLTEGSTRSTRPIYGQRILETTVPGTHIYWGEWEGPYQAIKNTVIYIAALAIEQPVYNYLFSIFTGFSPQDTSQVGIEIGYSYNTYMKQAQIQSTPGGAWETYYTAYRYDYFRYDRTTVQNPAGINPPLLQHCPPPSSIPYRLGISPNFNNHGEISWRGSMLFQNYCPAGWENETNVYYPLNMG